MKTLLELITRDWRAAGNRGQLTREYIIAWRAAHPAYNAKCVTLDTRFHSGSAVPVRGLSPLQRATDQWISDGKPAPGSPEFDQREYDAFLAEHCDEFDMEYYPAAADAKKA